MKPVGGGITPQPTVRSPCRGGWALGRRRRVRPARPIRRRRGVGNDGLADFDVQLEVFLDRADQSFFRSLVINDSVGGKHPVAGEGGIGKRNRAGLGGARLQGTDDGIGHGGLAGRGGVHGEGVGLLAVDAGPAIRGGSAGGVRVGVVRHDEERAVVRGGLGDDTVELVGGLLEPIQICLAEGRGVVTGVAGENDGEVARGHDGGLRGTLADGGVDLVKLDGEILDAHVIGGAGIGDAGGLLRGGIGSRRRGGIRGRRVGVRGRAVALAVGEGVVPRIAARRGTEDGVVAANCQRYQSGVLRQ